MQKLVRQGLNIVLKIDLDMKYIDADILRGKIESIGLYAQKNADYNDGRNDMKMMVLDLIDSLQKEQQIDKQIVVISESHGDANIEWDCRSIDDVKELLAAGARYISKEQEWQKDTEVLYTKLVNLLKTYRIGEETAIILADRIADTYGAQRYMDGLCDGVKQEQPEVELEKELNRYLRGEFQQTAGGNFNNYIQVARHFYELGLNARKK